MQHSQARHSDTRQVLGRLLTHTNQRLETFDILHQTLILTFGPFNVAHQARGKQRVCMGRLHAHPSNTLSLRPPRFAHMLLLGQRFSSEVSHAVVEACIKPSHFRVARASARHANCAP